MVNTKLNKIIQLVVAIIFTFAQHDSLMAQEDMGEKTEIVVKAPIGSGEGQIGYKEFNESAWVEPIAMAADSKGNIYVADTLNERIQKYSKEGKYLFKIAVTTPLKRTNEYVNDITVDGDDYLYAFIKNAQIIYKYDPNGNLVKTINYNTLLDADKISVHTDSHIYLYSFTTKRLSKLSKEGIIEGTWSGVASFFPAADGNLLISNNKISWEKYDKNGKLVGSTVCDQENMKVYFPTAEDGGCHFPPQFIDKNGNRYFLKNEEKPRRVTYALIFDRNGIFGKKIMMPFPADIYPQSNLVKFGNDGNFYTEYGYIQEGFQIMRIKLN